MSVTIVPFTFFSSFPSHPPTHFHQQIKTEHTKPRQKITNQNKVYLTSIFSHYWFIKISGGRFTPSRFSIWYPEVNIWPWLALNRLQWRLKYWIESRLVNSTNSLPIHFILSDLIIWQRDGRSVVKDANPALERNVCSLWWISYHSEFFLHFIFLDIK